MWNILTFIFSMQCTMVLLYMLVLRTFVVPYAADPEVYDWRWWVSTLLFGIPFWYTCIQNIYICHDVMHGATFPPYEWQRYITHCWSDFHSLPWEEFILEHNRHHASTQDLLLQGSSAGTQRSGSIGSSNGPGTAPTQSTHTTSQRRSRFHSPSIRLGLFSQRWPCHSSTFSG
jgi:fatty acid desaturase